MTGTPSGPRARQPPKSSSRLYWTVAIALVAMGLLGLASYGWPLLVAGIGLVVAAPVRDRERAFRRRLLAVVVPGWLIVVLVIWDLV